MKTHVFTARAIASEFALSFIKPVTAVLAVILIAVILVAWFLSVQFSAWWWLLALPFGIIGTLLGSALLVAWAIVLVIRPNLTSVQRRAVRDFMDKVSGLNEAARTPYPLLVARIALDFVIHRDGRYVRGLISDSKSLKGEYQAIQKYFEVKPTQQ